MIVCLICFTAVMTYDHNDESPLQFYVKDYLYVALVEKGFWFTLSNYATQSCLFLFKILIRSLFSMLLPVILISVKTKNGVHKIYCFHHYALACFLIFITIKYPLICELISTNLKFVLSLIRSFFNQSKQVEQVSPYGSRLFCYTSTDVWLLIAWVSSLQKKFIFDILIVDLAALLQIIQRSRNKIPIYLLASTSKN